MQHIATMLIEKQQGPRLTNQIRFTFLSACHSGHSHSSSVKQVRYSPVCLQQTLPNCSQVAVIVPLQEWQQKFLLRRHDLLEARFGVMAKVLPRPRLECAAKNANRPTNILIQYSTHIISNGLDMTALDDTITLEILEKSKLPSLPLC